MVKADESNDRPEHLADKIAAVLGLVARAQRARRQAVATRYGLTPLQLELLSVLVKGAPPQPLVGLLAAEVGVTQPTATDSLRALADKGLVERHRDPADGRRTAIALTGEGRRVIGEIDADRSELVDAISLLPDGSQEAMLDALLEVVARLFNSGAIDVARTCSTCSYHHHDGRAHRCVLLGVEIPVVDLRVDCREHQPV